MHLDILFQDEFLVAVNKPHGLLVHRSSMATNTDIYALQLLRDQLNQKVYPVHRLDRKTSGILLFALSPEVNSQMQKQFSENKVSKTYTAIVRGFTLDSQTLDYNLINEKGKSQNAVTSYKTLDRKEINVPLGKFQTSRYSLVEITPETGRFHQIRKHFAHLRHPIIGDRPHGCNKQNKLFKEKWNMITMMLHANYLKFNHPDSNEIICIKADFQNEFKRTLELVGFTPFNYHNI